MKKKNPFLRRSLCSLLIGLLIVTAAGCSSKPVDVSKKTAKVSETSVVVQSDAEPSVSESSVWKPGKANDQSSNTTEPSSSKAEETSQAEESSQTADPSSDAPSDPSQSSDDADSSADSVSSEITQSSAETSKGSVFDLPEVYQDNGIFSAYYDDAYRYLSKMTLEEKIGQMIIAAKPTYEASELATEYHLGGFIIMGPDFADKSKEEVQSMLSTLTNSQKVPLIYAVDEEGGTVTRISAKPQLSPHEFQSPRVLYKNGGMAYIQSDADEKASLLKELGLNINFAPVCDMSDNKKDFIYDRSLGQDAKTTADFIRIVTEISQSKGVSVTLKHFPGYGGNADTHIGVSVDDRSLDEFRKKDFIPFQSGIQAGAHLVMMSHNIVKAIEEDIPCSLSPNSHQLLRDELGFTGLIVTDDLGMDAISKYSGDHTAAVAAVLAGNDLLLMNNSMVEESFDSIKAAVESSVIDEKLIDRAVLRILSYKYMTSVM